MTSRVDFKDKGDTIQIIIKIPQDLASEAQPKCESNTTSLSVSFPSGESILNIPQLYGTVDASKTSCSRDKDTVTIVLHKLGSDKWDALKTHEGEARPETSQSNGTDPQNALAVREKVKQIFEAAMEGRSDEVRSLAKEVSPEGLNRIKDGRGRNVLHFAAVGGHADLIKDLVQQEGLDVNAQDEAGESALGLASAASQSEAISALIDLKADIELADRGQARPLHRASATGSAEVVSRLLKAGADKEADSSTGTPILWAAGSSNLPALNCLLEAGANCNATSSDGCSAMLMAAAGGEIDIVEALAAKGANANLKAEGGVTALHAAAEMGNLEVVKSLLKAGADPDSEDGEGAKAIHAAASAGNREIVEYLLPLTQQPNHSKWNIDALMADTSSASESSPPQKPTSSSGQDVSPNSAEALQLKREGNEAFIAKDFQKAQELYTEALALDADDHITWCNRSGANLRLGNAEIALSDAQRSRALKAEYTKAWFREGEAAKALKLWEDAAVAYYQAFTLNPNDARLAREFQAAVEEGRKQHREGKDPPRGKNKV